MPADYNGDGYADVAVRRPSNFTWYIKNSNDDYYNSSKGDGIQRIVFGKNADDIPVVADYDGDGIADIAVRRASNQMFYIKNSSGSNFNSSNEDGIQRHNFGKRETDTPIVQPLHAIYDDPNRPYDLNETSGVRVDMFSRDELPVMKVTLDLTQYPDGDYAVDSIRLDRPLGAVDWYPEGRFDIVTAEETINVRGTSEGENVYEYDIAGDISGEDGLNMNPSGNDSNSLSVEASFVKNIVGGEIAGERPKMVAINLVNLDTEEEFFVDFSVEEETENTTETVSIEGINFTTLVIESESKIYYSNIDSELGTDFVISHLLTEEPYARGEDSFEVYIKKSGDEEYLYAGRKGVQEVPGYPDLLAINISSLEGLVEALVGDQGSVNEILVVETALTGVIGFVAFDPHGGGQQVYLAD